LAVTETTLRQITLLQLLPRRTPGLRTTELRDRLVDRGFAIHLRTVQRDLDRLSARFGFTSDEGTPPRWFWPPGAADLSIPAQDPVSALTWQLIEQYLEPVLPASVKREAEGQFRAAREVLNASCAHQLQRWRSRVRLLGRGLPLQPPEIDPAVLAALHSALLESRQLGVEYRARQAARSKTMRVNPLGLVIREPVYYLIGTANDYSDVIQLALHRFDSAEVLPEPVSEPAGFDLDRYIEDGGFLYPHGSKIDLVVCFDAYTAQHLREAPLSARQTVSELPDGRVEIRARVLDSQHLQWWLMGFGDKAEVIAPPALRNALRDQFARLQQRYSS